MPIETLQVNTSHALLHVQQSVPKNDAVNTPAILLIHGNSFCLKVFKHIFASNLTKTHHIITFDLPGHGLSGDAPNPQKSYNQPAYAEAAIELLTYLKVNSVVVFGWSLGGHIAIEMIPRFHGIKGIMITGTPPVRYGELSTAFTFGSAPPKEAYAARDDLSPEELAAFAKNCADAPYEEWMLECVTRTDGRARKLMFQAFDEPSEYDQKSIVATEDVPVAVVNGADEPFINLEWVRSIEYRNLWRGECIEMPGLLHAPFWGAPDEFQPILEAFVKDVST